MYKPRNHGGGILLAGLVAGPLLISTSLLAAAFLMLPEPITVEVEVLPKLLVFLLISMIPGMTVGLLVNGLGTVLMMLAAEHFAWARSAASWTFVGGLIGFTIAWPLNSPMDFPAAVVGMTVTSAICAWLCQYPVDWSDGADEED